jgi:hypothetical protein
MLPPTALDAALIQYQAQICMPSFGEKREYEWPQDPIVVRLSDNRPEDLIRTPSFSLPRWTATPPDCSLDEMLDWDFVADTDPERILGTISVTLKYVNLDFPVNIEDILD